MASSKDTFESHSFRAHSFASGLFRGLGFVDTSFRAESIHALLGAGVGVHTLTGSAAFHTMLGAGIEAHALTGSALTHRLTGADTRNKELKG